MSESTKTSRASAPSDAGEGQDLREVPNEKAPGDCAICRLQTAGVRTSLGCWAWHRFCRGELNPVALYAFVTSPTFGEAGQRIGAHVAAATGMDVEAVKREIASWERT